MFTTISPGQIIAGFSVSTTVTIASHVATLPSLSVTVNVTVLAPVIEQSNDVIEAAKEAIPQLSVEPPSISAATIVALPAASNVTVMSEHKATGATLSSTVTVEVHVETLPLISVTVKVTVLAPNSVHVNAPGATAKEAIPQLSFDPLSISAPVIVAFPAASN